jgi:hypothetical protein
MPPTEFEQSILAIEWPPTYALDRTATGIGYKYTSALILVIAIPVIMTDVINEINFMQQTVW